MVDVFTEMANEVRDREPEVSKKVKDAYSKELLNAFILRPQRPGDRLIGCLLAFLGLTVVLACYLLLRTVLNINGFLEHIGYYMASALAVCLIAPIISFINYRWCFNSCDFMRKIVVLGFLGLLLLFALAMPGYSLITAVIHPDVGTLVTIGVATVVNVLLSPLIVILIIYIHVYNPRLLSPVFESY